MNAKDKRLAVLAIAVITVEWILFKLAYPFPDFFSDSYSYIDAAARHLDINIWPIGYSKFLNIFHAITYSDKALVSFQFYALEFSCLYFLITIKRIFKITKRSSIIFFILLFCNPIFFYLSNYVATEALFCALSIIWITELLLIIQKPNYPSICIQALCIGVAYTFRYNALYYPIITLVVLVISTRNWRMRAAGIGLIFAFIIPFIAYSRNAAKELTGTPETSILSGWQLANNALYIRKYIVIDNTSFVHPELRSLDSISVTFFKKVPPGFSDFLEGHAGNYFLQDWRAPLKEYMVTKYKETDVRAWALASPLFGRYGAYIIKTHPFSFVKYFVWINIGRFIQPKLEKLAIYNMGQDSVWADAQLWFHYPSPKTKVISKHGQAYLLALYPTTFFIFNVLFVGLILCIRINRIWPQIDPLFKKDIYLFGILWISNFLFSIVANVIVLRYQFFPLVITGALCLVLYDYLICNIKRQVV